MTAIKYRPLGLGETVLDTPFKYIHESKGVMVAINKGWLATN